MSYDCPLLLTTLTALGEIALLAPALFETQRPAIVRDFVVKELLMKDRVSVVPLPLCKVKNQLKKYFVLKQKDFSNPKVILGYHLEKHCD